MKFTKGLSGFLGMHRLSVKQRIVITFIIFILIPSTVFLFICIRSYSKYALNSIINEKHSIMEQINKNISYQFENYEDMTMTLYHNVQIKNYIDNEDYTEDSIYIKQFLSSIVNSEKYIVSAILNFNDKKYVSGNNYLDIENFFEKYQEEVISAKGLEIWIPTQNLSTSFHHGVRNFVLARAINSHLPIKELNSFTYFTTCILSSSEVTQATLFLIGNTVLSSFKSKQELINNTIGFPKKFTLENYYILLFEKGFLRYFINSFTLVACSLILLLIISSMVAYGLSRFKFKGRGILQTYFLIGLMFPIQLGILPLFIILTRMHLNNKLLGLALLYGANMSFPVLVFSRFFRSIPHSLSESARIDGAKERKVFVKIILPMSKPVLFTMGLINFVLIWNDFYMPLVFLTKDSVRTLTLAVYSYMANFLANWHLVFTAVVIALMPVIIIFFRFSDQIVAGLVGGAVKE